MRPFFSLSLSPKCCAWHPFKALVISSLQGSSMNDSFPPPSSLLPEYLPGDAEPAFRNVSAFPKDSAASCTTCRLLHGLPSVSLLSHRHLLSSPLGPYLVTCAEQLLTYLLLFASELKKQMRLIHYRQNNKHHPGCQTN